MSTQAEVLAQQFLTSYYQLFDTNRSGLKALYIDASVLMYEGQTVTGAEAIMAKLTSLSFQTIQHAVTKFDAQTTVDGGLLIFVIGQLKADNDPPLPFSQVFYLKQIGDSLFVTNDIFRLNLHNTA